MKTAIIIGAVAAFFGVAQATTYAQFCNDDSCADGCGESVSVDNPGCLNENGRRSIKFHDINFAQVALVFSPTPNCPCQNYCQENILDCQQGGLACTGPSCFNLSNLPGAQSFRFIGGGSCDPNNC